MPRVILEMTEVGDALEDRYFRLEGVPLDCKQLRGDRGKVCTVQRLYFPVPLPVIALTPLPAVETVGGTPQLVRRSF